jgi:hypothetical protein
MKRAVALLACTTATFGVATAYLFLQLRQERARNTRAEVAAVATTAPVPRTAQSGAVDEIVVTEAPSAIQNATIAATDADKQQHTATRMAFVRQEIERLQDPTRRAEQVALAAGLYRTNWQAIAEHLHLSPDEYTRFVSALAERVTQRTQRKLECETRTDCNLAAQHEQDNTEQRRDIAELLGPERSAQLKAYQTSDAERGQTYWLDMQLPANAKLSSSQAEQLVSALVETRQQFDDRAAQRGEHVEQSGHGAVQLRSAAVPGASDEQAQRLESATRYLQEQYRRAAAILDAQQLARLKAEQDTALMSYRSELRRKAAWSAAEAAARSGN